MKTKLNLFYHSLHGPTHSEVVLPVSFQLNNYSKVQDKYKWMRVFSIKFLIWEFGFAITKPDIQKRKRMDVYNEEDVNYSEEPIFNQFTSVPEKQIGDE